MWWSVLAAIVRDNDHIVLPHSVLPAAHASQKAAALSTGLELFRNAKSGEIAGLVDEVIASNPKSSARNEALAKPLTWFMVKTMARSGLATFGCHTVSHPVLARLDRESAEQEICLARDRLADELGRPPTFFAYPYGGDPDIGSGAPALVARAGFTAAFTTRRAVLCGSDLDSPYMLPRIAVSGLYQHRTALRAYLLMAEKGW
jgi:peptidoglycan/xylan/chitin deacetylase (PgdA/CDA1 family)